MSCLFCDGDPADSATYYCAASCPEGTGWSEDTESCVTCSSISNCNACYKPTGSPLECFGCEDTYGFDGMTGNCFACLDGVGPVPGISGCNDCGIEDDGGAVF